MISIFPTKNKHFKNADLSHAQYLAANEEIVCICNNIHGAN